MQKQNNTTRSRSSTRRTRRRLFPPPALRKATSRYRQIRMRSAASWSNVERAYLELHDLLEAFPHAFPQALHLLVKDAAIDDEVLA